ncbi:MAG: FtsQ-type POTRA domain-containing protein [Myxococcota bacterium]
MLHTFQGRPFYGVSLQQIAEKAGEHPRVKTVWVQRSFPHTLYVGVTQRTPLATLEWGRQLFGVHEDGKLFPMDEEVDPSGLPQIVFLPGCSASTEEFPLFRRCVRMIQQHQQIGSPGGLIERIAVRPTGNMIVHMQKSFTVYMGGDDFEDQWRRVASILLSPSHILSEGTLYFSHAKPPVYTPAPTPNNK